MESSDNYEQGLAGREFLHDDLATHAKKLIKKNAMSRLDVYCDRDRDIAYKQTMIFACLF